MRSFARPSPVTVVLVLCAIVLTGANLSRVMSRPLTKPMREVGDWRAYAAAGQRVGPAESPVTITVWSDYECGFCRDLNDRLNDIKRENGDNVAIVWRHYPIPSHPYARRTATAALCAEEQGRFQPAHQILFANPAIPLDELAQQADIPDQAAFARCLVSDEPKAMLTRDSIAAVQLGAQGTPNILVNNGRFQGVPPDLAAIVRHEIRRTT